MSESTTIEDLDLLRGNDLKVILDALTTEEVVAALWGMPISLHSRLLGRLTKRDAAKIEKVMAATDLQTFEQVREAQQKAVAMMCQMSRSGLIAFDVPEDMVA